ncbi:MAG: universal stress protein [Acidimicrobiales bacterium]
MYQTVVVPLDGSELAERALGPATAVARAAGAAVQLLRVASSREAKEAHDYLEGWAARLDVPCRPPYVIEADWAAECIANAAEEPGSLVCMTSHGKGGIRRLLLGSVAEDVLRLSRRAVLVVGPELASDRVTLEGGKLLVCTDGSELSESILPVAEQWVTSFGMEPWVTTVVDPDAPTRAAGPEPVSDTVDSMHVERIARELGAGATGGWEVLYDGAPADTIVEFAARLPATIVAMATHGTTGLARVAIGSVAADVLRHAPCPVLLLRPQGLDGDDAR